MIQTLTIPDWTPPTSNQWYGKSWRVRYKLGQDAKSFVWLYAAKQRIVKASGRRRVSLEVHGWAKGKTPDLDAFDKLLLDALTHYGLLTDDSPEGLEGRMEVTIVRSKERKTIITLEDVHGT